MTGGGASLSLALRDATARLRAGGIPDPVGDARVLLAHATGIDPGRLTLHLPDSAAAHHIAALSALIDRRLAHEPVSHLLGYRLFWGHRFAVTADVLDPRPETETLVAEALARPFSQMLDLGTGSGCILLSCLADRPEAVGTGVDLSPAALVVAAGNAGRLGLSARARFQQSDWLAAVQGPFDLIVSNPPYISAAEMADLSPEVLREPHLALTPGGDGLAAYRAITIGAPVHLAPGGRLILEIGPTQGQAVASLFAAQGFESIRILPDLDGRDRIVVAQKPADP